jgi:hypothetical protein
MGSLLDKLQDAQGKKMAALCHGVLRLHRNSDNAKHKALREILRELSMLTLF